MPLNLDVIRAGLPDRQVIWFERTASTMAEAAKLAGEGCPSGAVAIAEEQTAGQGRLGRAWHSEPESGLYFSVVLRLPLSPESAPCLTLALGLAASSALKQATGVECDLRWPNDVLIGERKCAGILVQLEAGAFIAGIGVNINHASFPAGLDRAATSLRIATGKAHPRELILIHLLDSIEEFTTMLLAEGTEAILRLFSEASSYARGKRVVVDNDGTVLRGVTDGLDPSGFLFVKQEDGTRALVLAGGVRPA